MAMQRGSLVFGVTVGLIVALLSYRWISNPVDRSEREREEQVVLQARVLLQDKLELPALEIVDPLAPQRKVGKVYIYPASDGWEVSGYYRRDTNDRWHDFLMRLDAQSTLRNLKVRDAGADIAQLAASDPAIEVVP